MFLPNQSHRQLDCEIFTTSEKERKKKKGIRIGKESGWAYTSFVAGWKKKSKAKQSIILWLCDYSLVIHRTTTTFSFFNLFESVFFVLFFKIYFKRGEIKYLLNCSKVNCKNNNKIETNKKLVSINFYFLFVFIVLKSEQSERESLCVCFSWKVKEKCYLRI